jgi:allantoinase
VGGWRLIDLFDSYQLPLSVLLNTSCYEHCPELVAAFRKRGDEIVAHGYTNSEHQNGMPEDSERLLIQNVTSAIAEHEGAPPRGWMSPGAHPSAQTEDLLAEAGYTYTLDWPIDDQPVWMKTRGGPLLSIPYPHEVNDVPMIVLHDGTASAFADISIDSIDEMAQQSQAQPLVLGITIHTFIVGQPFRIKQFRRVLDHLRDRRDEIWVTTPGAIASHYAGLFAATTDMRVASTNQNRG